MKDTPRTPPSLEPFEPGEPSISVPVQLTDELRAKLLTIASCPTPTPHDVASVVSDLNAAIEAATPLDDRLPSAS